MMEVVDDQTIRSTSASRSRSSSRRWPPAYGPFVINTKYVEENKTDDDPWAHEFYLNGAPGSGTGPYMLTENEVTQQVTIEKFEGFHGGWEARTSIRSSCGLSGEIATRRESSRTARVTHGPEPDAGRLRGDEDQPGSSGPQQPVDRRLVDDHEHCRGSSRRESSKASATPFRTTRSRTASTRVS